MTPVGQGGHRLKRSFILALGIFISDLRKILDMHSPTIVGEPIKPANSIRQVLRDRPHARWQAVQLITRKYASFRDFNSHTHSKRHHHELIERHRREPEAPELH